MSTIKTRISNELIQEFIARHDGIADPSSIETIADGEVSQALFFTANTGQKVLRINATSDEGFKKDDFASKHFAGEHLPIPIIEEVGQLENGMFFAVSERSPGKTLDKFSTDEINELMPNIITTLGAIHETPSIGGGFGWINLDGRGASDSWAEALDKKQHVEADSELIDCPFFESDYVAELRIRIKDHYKFCPQDIRQLYHGDYGFNNTLSDGEKITGVIDWHSSGYGDPLYDVAWLDFWGSWQGYADAFHDHFKTRGSLPENFDERLICYKLLIGANSLAFFAKSDQQEKYCYAKQVVEKL